MIRQQENAPPSPKLSEVLFEATGRNFGTLAALPSNVEAVESVLLFATGLQSFVVLTGPSGWGKSHLLDAISYRMGQDACLPPEVLSAEDWVSRGMRSPADGPLLLDNVQDLLERGRSRQSLRLALERRVRTGRPTILSFTAARMTRSIRSMVPTAREWVFSHVPAPEAAERVLVVHQMARSEGVLLATGLARVLAYKINGNGHTYAGALKRLKLHGNDWSAQDGFLRACGILDPFFVDNSSWDLREKIVRATEGLACGKDAEERRALAIHLMLREAGLSEVSVARFLGIEPSEAYLQASLIDSMMKRGPEVASLVARCRDAVVDALLAD
jgi:hypothetical protein